MTTAEGAPPIRVVVVDDDESMRALLRLTFDLEPRLDVVAEAATGAEAIEMIGEHRPDAVVLDVMMPGRDGIEVLPELCSVSPESKIVVFTAYATVPIVQAALERGASLVLEKTVPQRDVVAAILDLAGG